MSIWLIAHLTKFGRLAKRTNTPLKKIQGPRSWHFRKQFLSRGVCIHKAILRVNVTCCTKLRCVAAFKCTCACVVCVYFVDIFVLVLNCVCIQTWSDFLVPYHFRKRSLKLNYWRRLTGALDDGYSSAVLSAKPTPPGVRRQIYAFSSTRSVLTEPRF